MCQGTSTTPSPSRSARPTADGAALCSERGCRAGGAEQLHHDEARASGPETLSVAGQLGEQYCELPAEGDRHGGLGMGAAWHHGRPVRLGLRRELLAECLRERVDSIERAPSEKRETGVHDVLRGGSPVDVPSGLGGVFADLLEEGKIG